MTFGELELLKIIGGRGTKSEAKWPEHPQSAPADKENDENENPKQLAAWKMWSLFHCQRSVFFREFCESFLNYAKKALED